MMNFQQIFPKSKIINTDFMVICIIYKIKKTLKITQILSFQTHPNIKKQNYSKKRFLKGFIRFFKIKKLKITKKVEKNS